MFIERETLDDLLHSVLRRLLRSPQRTVASKGPAREIVAVLLKIRNPRARFSGTESRATLFSCLGELMWYLSGTNSLEFIKYYIPRYAKFSDDAASLHGAYGARLFGGGLNSQFHEVARLLQRKQDTRQAVIQIFSKDDLLAKTKDVPCTCTIQFFMRAGTLDALVHMRSNDALIGLPHDVFAFTMLQEIMARTLSCELGTYNHCVGSLHLYDSNRKTARKFLAEGLQTPFEMPPMPIEDPWPSISWLQNVESNIREGRLQTAVELSGRPYWTDLARLLLIKRLFDERDLRSLIRQKNALSTKTYDSFIRYKTSSPGVPAAPTTGFPRDIHTGEAVSK